ncbi:endonuclease domain-containing protein [Sphingorhabdus sp. EL138]|uniref:endonuclease domain-containing protein n=1 Tax=Sphingorhabdus sp. EL138 TaxID=2073156 RepID=UPI00345DC75B
MSEHQTPPRTGEGDHPKDGGGVLSALSNAYAVAKRERRSGNLPEVLIWRELRKRPGGYKFRRQHPLSDVVIDFVCLECRLAIEIDGEAHGAGDRPERDAQRDIYLRSRGFHILRLPAVYVLQSLEDALATIVAACAEHQPLHHQPLAGGPPPRSGEVFESSSP